MHTLYNDGKIRSLSDDVRPSFKFLSVKEVLSKHYKFQMVFNLSSQKFKRPTTTAHESVSSSAFVNKTRKSKTSPVYSYGTERRHLSLAMISLEKRAFD